MEPRADQLFTSFRKSGDPSELAEVFDLCAPDLLKVAVHLCPTDGEAEDLVQETFLFALEHAGRYRSGEPVSPWLLGILRNRARELRRRTARHPEADRLHQPVVAQPGELLLQGEFREAYEAALLRIPMPYREVLDLRLGDGLGASEIAQRLERPPGTVRTQIYRATELLRAALPASTAALLASHTMTRGMASVRAHIVEEAGLLQHTTWTLTGLLAMKKTALACAAVLLASSVWYATRDVAASPPQAKAATLGAGLSADRGTEATDLAAAKPDAGPAAGPAREAAAQTPPTAQSPEPAEGWPFLVPPYEVTVLVVDTRLEPVVGALVTVHEGRLSASSSAGGGASTGGSSEPSERAYSGRETGADPVMRQATGGLGTSALRLDREVCYVSAEHEDFGRSLDVGVSRRLDGEVLRIVLEPQTRVTGVVRDGRGVGAAGATVQSWTMGGGSGGGSTPPVQAVTGSDGTYELVLPAGLLYGLRAKLGDSYSDHTQVTATASGGGRRVDFDLPGAYRVLGRVVTPDAEPAKAGTVVVRSTTGDRRRSGELQAGEQGRFEVLLTAPGEYLVSAEAPGFAHSEPLRVVLDEKSSVLDVNLRLQATGHMAGRVLDPDGQPVSGLELQVNRQLPGKTGWDPGQEALVVSTNGHGAFRVEGTQPSSSYTFSFKPNPDSPQLRQFVRNVEGHRGDIEIRLEPALLDATSVTGLVLDGATGQPVTSFEVRLRELRENGSSQGQPQAFSSEDGRFEVTGLELGLRYDVEVQLEGRQQVMRSAEWTASGEHHVEVVFPEPATFECRVWDRDGAPAQEVRVRFVLVGDIGNGARAETDKAGTAVIPLLPGTYRVHAAVPPGVRPEPIEVEARAGERQQVNVQLR